MMALMSLRDSQTVRLVRSPPRSGTYLFGEAVQDPERDSQSRDGYGTQLCR